MSRNRQYMNLTNGWEQTADAVTANLADLSHLEIPLGRLNGVTERARGLLTQQSTLKAAKQETSRLLRQAMQEGETLVDFVRTGVRQHYGQQSEKLVEFGVQPLRVKARTAKAKATSTENPNPQPPASPSSTPTPDTTK